MGSGVYDFISVLLNALREVQTPVFFFKCISSCFSFEDVHGIMYTFYSFYDCLPSQTA